jgi:hypothetical protein
MITRVFPGWYVVNKSFYYPTEQLKWCKENIGFSDKDTWVFQTINDNPQATRHFSFKDEKWAQWFVLRWT